MARILGWYKKRAGKAQTKTTDVYCSCGWHTRNLGGEEHRVIVVRVIVVEAHHANADEPDVPIENLRIELTAAEARSLVNQILNAVEYMERPPVERKYPREKP